MMTNTEIKVKGLQILNKSLGLVEAEELLKKKNEAGKQTNLQDFPPSDRSILQTV